jgi:hypothetical protein
MANNIGILASIPFTTTPFGKAFLAEWGGPLPLGAVEQDIGYASAALDEALGRLDAANPDLIVTVGGVAPAVRAAQPGRTTPFISLVGSTPAALTGSAIFRGAVNLESIIHNSHRILHIIQFGHAQNDVCLLVNTNSQMAGDEQANWPSPKVKAIAVDQTTANPATVYASAFGSLPAGTRAVVISADPFFTKTASDLVGAANAWVAPDSTRRVAYGLHDYGMYSPTQALVYGPKLEEEYKRLARKAARVCNHIHARWTVETAQQLIAHH